MAIDLMSLLLSVFDFHLRARLRSHLKVSSLQYIVKVSALNGILRLGRLGVQLR